MPNLVAWSSIHSNLNHLQSPVFLIPGFSFFARSRFLANTSFHGQTGKVYVHNTSHVHTARRYKVWSLLRDSVGQPTWVTVGSWTGDEMEVEEGTWPQHLQRKHAAEGGGGGGFSRTKLRVVTLVEHPFVFTREVRWGRGGAASAQLEVTHKLGLDICISVLV